MGKRNIAARKAMAWKAGAWAAALLLACAFFLPGPLAWAAQGEGGAVQPSQLKAGEDAGQLILILGKKTGSQVEVTYYVKEKDGSWKTVFSTPGVYGKNGAAKDKKEGDGKTPLGVFGLTMAFGLKKDPGSLLPYHQIGKDDYWVDDPDSKYYNQLVDGRAVAKDWKSAEAMAAGAPYYDYGLALDYNAACVPGKGSAIFIHCAKSKDDAGSLGCVRIPQEEMKTLVKSVDKTAKVVIVSDASQLEKKG